MNIYLAGDSIVQNYTEEEFIAGWGQFLPRFFKSDVNDFLLMKEDLKRLTDIFSPETIFL